MYGAIYGDIIGSYYEVHCTKNYDFELHRDSTFTDDSVMTAAVCKAILQNPQPITKREIRKRAFEYAVRYKQYFSYYPHAGYGNMFSKWASDRKNMKKQHSYGNGGAMRAVPIGYAYDSLEQVMLQAKASCFYTHNNREAIRGAQAVAAAVYLANYGESKSAIREYISKNFRFDLDYTVDEIRPAYSFDSSTSYSVPPAIVAFLDSEDYESAVRNAVSLGGDADTMACIAGGIAEAFYRNIPEHIQRFCDSCLEYTIKSVVNEFKGRFIVNNCSAD